MTSLLDEADGGLAESYKPKQSKDTKPITVTPDMLVGDYELKVDINKSLPKLKANEYQCAACGEVYEYDWSDGEAQAEYEENFPTYAKRGDAVDIVCDDCYLQLTAWKSPQEAEEEVST